MLSRRDLLQASASTCLLPSLSPLIATLTSPKSTSMRCINVVNFIRAVEPRFETDLMLPVQKQMEILLAHGLPATWLLRFDALVSGGFVDYLKSNMAKDHEVGFWFEMNEKHCRAAGVEWRGRPGYEWDSSPPVAFTIGYTPEERIKLAEAAMREFKRIWGFFPSSVASWNLDSVTVAYLSSHYGVDAFAVCRDQIATDGFTIWGAPIAGYYPSKVNCWSPALQEHDQIGSPIFRMLGQDPVYYYSNKTPLPDGKIVHEPDTMEPVWTSGRSQRFVDTFLGMICQQPALGFAYAQMGQENSFPWHDQEQAYAPQMEALAELRKTNLVQVETLGETGRRFKVAFPSTPPQSQVQLEDPFGNTPGERTVWYQSRFYRANLHFEGSLPFFRDLTVYSSRFPQPFLSTATRDHEVEQRMPAILDGFHWRTERSAGGYFESEGKRLHVTEGPHVKQLDQYLEVNMTLDGDRRVALRFTERQILIRSRPSSRLEISFEWNTQRAQMLGVEPKAVVFRLNGFEYQMRLEGATAKITNQGWVAVSPSGSMEFELNQE